MRGSLRLDVIRGHTGRKVRGGEEYERARAWARRQNRLGLIVHSAHLRFQRDLKHVPVVAEPTMRCYRGRVSRTVHTWEEMGPPPATHTTHGRYNSAGSPVLYLSTTMDGVAAELASPRAEPLAMQEYEIPSVKLQIADLASPACSDLIHAVMDLAESSDIDGRTAEATGKFSRFVADCVRQAGFDGMLVPSVRGIGGNYKNVVVFSPRDWKEWSKKDAGFSIRP